MRHLHIDPRLLQRMQSSRRRSGRATLRRPHRRHTLQRRDRLPAHSGNRRHTRTDLLAVQQHRAGTTLRETAAEARAVQMQLVVQDVQEWCVEAGGHVVHETVHLDLQLARHRHLLIEGTDRSTWRTTASLTAGGPWTGRTASQEPRGRATKRHHGQRPSSAPAGGGRPTPASRYSEPANPRRRKGSGPSPGPIPSVAERAFGVYLPAAFSTARTRAGVIGASRMRTPVASKNAFATAAGTGDSAGSPEPVVREPAPCRIALHVGAGEPVDVDRRGVLEPDHRVGHPVEARHALLVEHDRLVRARGRGPASQHPPRCSRSPRG